MIRELGIDVSENNGEVNFEEVAAAGVKFVMVRSSYGQHGVDGRFVENVNAAHAAGLKCGAYHYGYGLDEEESKQEAINCQKVIDDSGLLLELPVFYDMEDADKYKEKHGFVFSLPNIDRVVQGFLKQFPYNKGIYASAEWLALFICWEDTGLPVWNAAWPYSLAYPVEEMTPEKISNLCNEEDSFRSWIWQFTDKLVIGEREFDGDIWYCEDV